MLLLWRFGSNWLLAAHFSSFPRTEQLPVCSSVLLYLRSNLCTTVLLKEILDTRLGKRQFFTLLLTLWVIRAVKNFTFSNLLLFEFLLLCWYAMLLDFNFLLGLDPHRCQLLSTFSSCQHEKGKMKCWRLDLFLVFSIHNVSIFLASLFP